MKKITFYAIFGMCMPLFGQIQDDISHAPIIDTIIKISINNTDYPVWNYSGIDFANYPNTIDVDLKPIQNIQDLANLNNLLLPNDSVVGELPSIDLLDGGLTFKTVGSYVYKQGKQGNLLIASDTIANAKQVIYTENYFLLHENDSIGYDTVAYYNNMYYSFLNSSSNNRVFEVFNKKRSLKGYTNWEYNGISFCTPCISTFTMPDIQLNLSPNPTSEFTMISFTLPVASEISISLSNQTNTVDEILYTGLATEGYNEFQLMTQIYGAGNYTLTVSTSTGQYSSILIIL